MLITFNPSNLLRTMEAMNVNDSAGLTILCSVVINLLILWSSPIAAKKMHRFLAD
jgi:hypothetical protein